MITALSRQEAERLIRNWLSKRFGFAPDVIRPHHIFVADLGVGGEGGDELLVALHQTFGTDFSELDADAGFGIEDEPPVGLLAADGSARGCLLDRIVPEALLALGDDPLSDDVPLGNAADPWEDALVSVGDLVEAVAQGTWVRRDGTRSPGEGRLDTLADGSDRRIAAHRAAVRAYVASLRDRIRHPGAPLPERAWRKPVSGIRREQAIRCPWCGRRELVFLDPRFGEWRFTCLACGGDAALRGWSRALATVTDRFKLDARLLLASLPAIPWLLGMPVMGAFGLLAAVVFVLFTATGYGQTRRLPGGAAPQPQGSA